MKHTQALKTFFIEVIKEMKKIHWPSNRELFISFFATIAIVIAFSFFFAFVDGIIGAIVKKIIYMVN